MAGKLVTPATHCAQRPDSKTSATKATLSATLDVKATTDAIKRKTDFGIAYCSETRSVRMRESPGSYQAVEGSLTYSTHTLADRSPLIEFEVRIDNNGACTIEPTSGPWRKLTATGSNDNFKIMPDGLWSSDKIRNNKVHVRRPTAIGSLPSGFTSWQIMDDAAIIEIVKNYVKRHEPDRQDLQLGKFDTTDPKVAASASSLKSSKLWRPLPNAVGRLHGNRLIFHVQVYTYWTRTLEKHAALAEPRNMVIFTGPPNKPETIHKR